MRSNRSKIKFKGVEEVIPISEVERVISRLKMHFDNFIAIKQFERADAMETAMIELKELLPK